LSYSITRLWKNITFILKTAASQPSSSCPEWIGDVGECHGNLDDK